MKCNYVAEILTSCEVVGVKGQVLTFLSQINMSSINTPWSESCLCWHPLLEPPTLLQLCTGARRYAMTSSVGVVTGAAMHIADNAPPELEVKLTGQHLCRQAGVRLLLSPRSAGWLDGCCAQISNIQKRTGWLHLFQESHLKIIQDSIQFVELIRGALATVTCSSQIYLCIT